MKPEEEFEHFIRKIEFDDKPDYAHRDKLEQNLLASLARQSWQKSHAKWKSITTKNITKLAAAVMIAVAVLIGVNSLNGTSAWAEVIRAFNSVENVHVTQLANMPDGTIQKLEVWIRMPDCLYEDNHNRTVIDNGTDRLFIDKEKQTAQFSDSFMPFKSIGEHYIFDSINIFRKENQDDFEFKKLEEESSETILVFSLKFIGDAEDLDFKGKAWVDAKTMLPIKIQAELTSEPKEGNPVSGEVICSYDPIPDRVFAMIIPDDYKELPRKQRGVLSGTVLDENGKPVVNAIVFATDRGGEFTEKTRTDESGRFAFQLLPEGVGTHVWLPIMLRAYVENVPDKVAWTIIKDPKTKSKYVPGGDIPYEVATVENDGNLLRSANGITLWMEPAGAITGHVTDVNDSPIPDAKVRLLRCNFADQYGNPTTLKGINVLFWNGNGEEGFVKTDKNGRYELTNLPVFWKRTKFTLQAEAAGYAGWKSSFRSQASIEYEELDFQLYSIKPVLVISGVLKDNYGSPLEERIIYPRINGKDFWSFQARTDKQGRFKLAGSPIAEHIEVKAELSLNTISYNEKEKYLSYVYYPDVIVDIGYQKDKTSYEVEMIAVKPELIIEVEVEDSLGRALPYFPVEVRSDISPIAPQWVAERNLTQRTDKNGYCKFTDVPRIEGLKLIFSHIGPMWNDKLPPEERIRIAEDYRKYKDTEVPVELIRDQKEYKIDMTMLTKEESEK